MEALDQIPPLTAPAKFGNLASISSSANRGQLKTAFLKSNSLIQAFGHLISRSVRKLKR